MKRILLFLLVIAGSISTAFSQPNITADQQGQLWNVSNNYFGTVNANTIDGGSFLDSVKNTTSYLSLSNWYRTGKNAFDSARILKLNAPTTSNGYYVPYSWGLTGRGEISATANVLKASTTSSVTPTVIITPQQSPNGINGWVAIPGTTAATVTPSSRTAVSSITFNISDVFQRYLRFQVNSTDTCSVQMFYNFKPKTY